jgi:hypothetical protein
MTLHIKVGDRGVATLINKKRLQGLLPEGDIKKRPKPLKTK